MGFPVKRANVSNEGSGASNTFANILTVTKYGDDILIVAISVQDSNHANLPVTAVKWGGSGGQAFTKITSAEHASNVRTEIWAILNPDAGLKDLYIATTGSVWKGVVLSHWSGVKQTIPTLFASKIGSGWTPWVDITTNASESIVITAVSAEEAFLQYGDGQTGLGHDEGQPYELVVSSYKEVSTPQEVTVSEELNGSAPWAIAAVAIEPAQIVTIAKRKRFKYMVYSSAGVFKKRWMDVYSEPRFSSELNGGFSELVVELARSAVSFGEDGDIKYGNQLKLWCIDDGAPSGVLIYSGELTRYVPSIRGRVETLKVTFLGYWQQAARIVMEDDGTGQNTLVFKENCVPVMEADNTPSVHTASASTELSGFPAYLAFDENAQTKWTTNSVTTGWIKFDFGIFMSPKIQKYAITAPFDSATEAPKTWTLEGSNTGAFSGEQTTIDSQSNITDWTAGMRKEFEFSNANTYRYYRLNVSANNGHASYLSVARLELMEAYDRSGSTLLRYSAKDPAVILKDILDKFTGVGGKIDYVTSPANSVDTVGDSESYLLNMNTYQEAMKKVVDMCPVGWYLRVGADDIVYLKAKNSVADHTFILGQHISEYEPEKRTESLVNRVFFMGGDPGTGSNLYKKYTRSGSVSSYGKWDRRIIDDRVKLSATMDDIAARILDNFDAPEIRIVVKILDDNNEQGKGYDIESIKVGQTCKILNSTKQSENKWDSVQWDTAAWDYDITNAAAILLQIQRIEYSPDYCVLELSNRQPDIARRVEDINNRLMDDQTKDTPAIPTT